MALWPLRIKVGFCDFIKWFTDSRVEWWYFISIQDFTTKQSANTSGFHFSFCLSVSFPSASLTLVKVHVVTSGEMIRQIVIVPLSESEHILSCFAWETLSTVVVQHQFLRKFAKGHPSMSLIVKWHTPVTTIWCKARRNPDQGELPVCDHVEEGCSMLSHAALISNVHSESWTRITKNYYLEGVT